MKFEKTHSDLRMITSLPAEQINIDNVLHLLLDVMQDAIEETGMTFQNESITENSAGAFIAVARALNSMKTDRLTGGTVTAGRKERLKTEKENLSHTENNLQEVEQLLQEQQQTQEKLHQKLAVLKEKQERSRCVRNEIDSLQKQLDEIPDVDEEALAELKRQTEEEIFLLSDKQQEYLSLSEKLTAKKTELKNTLKAIEEAGIQDTEAGRQLERQQQLLRETKTALNTKINTKNQYISQIDLITREIGTIDTAISALETKYNEKKAVKDGKASRKLQRENGISELERNIAGLEKEENELKQKSLLLIKSIQLLTTGKQQLETEITQKTREYNEKSKQTGEDIIRLSETLSKLNEQIHGCEQSVTNLQNNIAETETALSELQKKTDELETQKNERQSELAQKNGEKQHMEDELQTCNIQLERLRLFFDSEECRKINSRIARLKEAIGLYQEAVQELFHKEISVYLLFDACGEEMSKQKNTLDSQIRQLEKDMSCLKDTYVETVTDIERRINQW